MVLLKNDAFLGELSNLFSKSRVKGTVSITMKKYDGRETPEPAPGKPSLPEPTEHYCLLRATLKNKKISTVIHQQDVGKFQSTYFSLLKGSFDGLKKLKKPKGKPKAT